MGQLFEFLFRWSEVWPWVLPLAIFFICRVKDKSIRPLVWLSAISLILAFFAVYCQQYADQVPPKWRDNTGVYNLLSIARTIFFGYYLIRIPKMMQYRYPKYVLLFYIIGIAIYFLNLGTLKGFNNIVFTIENFLLLVFCNTYFLGTIVDEDETLSISHPAFIVSAAMAVYGAINFFIYLFFYAIVAINMDIGILTMQVSKGTIIVLGLMLAIAVYLQRNKKQQFNKLITT